MFAQPIYNYLKMITTLKRMNLLLQKRRARLDMKVPAEFRDLVIEKAKEKEINYTMFIMVAAIEKIEREEVIN